MIYGERPLIRCVMPIFEYECQACGYSHEVLLAPGKRDPRRCPRCGKPKLSRKLSMFASGRGKADTCSPKSG